MYPTGMEAEFEARLIASRLDHDTVNATLKMGRRSDVPPDLGAEWINRWNEMELFDLSICPPEQVQSELARIGDSFFHNPVNRIRRAKFAATQSADPDLRLAGELAMELEDLLEAFGREIAVLKTSLFTGKVKFSALTDLDVVTTKAIVEVSTQPDASGKVGQLTVLLEPVANPNCLPVFHYFPNLNPDSRAAEALREAGSAGVYNDRIQLVSMIRTLT